jgi:hypothetical protein
MLPTSTLRDRMLWLLAHLHMALDHRHADPRLRTDSELVLARARKLMRDPRLDAAEREELAALASAIARVRTALPTAMAA